MTGCSSSFNGDGREFRGCAASYPLARHGLYLPVLSVR